jgi:hypothetical protein
VRDQVSHPYKTYSTYIFANVYAIFGAA